MLSAIEIDRPVEEIYRYLEEGQNSGRYINGEFTIQPVLEPPSQDGRYRLGSTAVGKASFFGAKLVTLVYRVVAAERNRLIVLRTQGGQFDSQVVWKLQPLSESRTRLSLQVDLKPRSGFIRTLLQDYIEPSVDRFLGRSLKNLKSLLERPALIAQVA